VHDAGELDLALVGVVDRTMTRALDWKVDRSLSCFP